MEQLPAIELRYLRYFVAVAEELSYRRAAKRLFVSAPAVSVQIKNLEDLLGVRLFERDTARVRLTVAGEVLLREARELFAQMRRAVTAVRDAARGKRGRLRVGIHGLFGENLIPELVRSYQDACPGVEVSLLDFVGNEAQLRALEEGRVHVAFIVAFQPPQMEGLEHLLAIDTPIRAVMSAKHPLAAKKQVTLAELAETTLLAIQTYETQTQSLAAVFARENLQLKSVVKTNTFNSCITMLAAGRGVALLPEIGVLSRGARLALRPIKDAPAGMRLHVYAVWKREGVRRQVLDFVELLREAGVRKD